MFSFLDTCISVKNQIGHFRDFFIIIYSDLFKIFLLSKNSTTTIKRSWILFWDICHLFWDTGYLSKNYFGIFEKIIQGYEIFGVIYYEIWDIGYPSKQASSTDAIHETG